MRPRPALLAIAAALLLTGAASAAPTARVLDDFEDLSPWKGDASDGVGVKIAPVTGVHGRAMRLDWDFGKVSGYAFAARSLPLDLPENYEISFRMRGSGPPNTFELKLTDAKNENVWWRQTRDLAFPSEWTEVRIKRRQVEFAWGPSADRTLRRAERIEFVVAAGAGGGKGHVEIDQLTIRERPPTPAIPPRPTANAAIGSAALAVDGATDTAWRVPAGPQSLTLDLGYEREFGGLTLRWAPGLHARAYEVMASDDGKAWRRLRAVENGDGGADPLMTTEASARWLRLDLREAVGSGFALAEVEVEDLAFGASPTAFVGAVAADSPRGTFPRGFHGEQPYWTLVGVDGGPESGLLSEDGALELRRGGPTLEPFVIEDGRVTGWADVKIEQALRDGYLPIPSVTWTADGWRLKTTAFAEGTRDQASLVGRWDLTNTSDRPRRLTLMVAGRPYQVNGPSQFLTTPGGVSPVGTIRAARGVMTLEATPVFALAPADAVAGLTFDAGVSPKALSTAPRAASTAVRDPQQLAAAAWFWTVDLAPGETRTFAARSDLGRPSPPPVARGAPASMEAREQAVADAWRARLDRFDIIAPPEARAVVDTVRTSLAHILMSRDGPILKPGTRSYNRSWIRDGAMIAEGLARLGSADLAAEYLHWYAPYLFDNGKVPCCVDSRGADPVPENDSHGEFVFLAAEVYRYTGDRALLEQVWPQVKAAVGYMDQLRASERTAANQTPERRHLYGLMPPSISHEGYSAKPAYSYWDDFWSARGYKDAVFIARALGRTGDAARFAASRDQFIADLHASIEASTRHHGVAFIPGAADLGDFDATSTTIGLTPGGEQGRLPPLLLKGTFDRYWTNFVERRDRDRTWDAYTPYELRVVSAFVRLGQRDRAMQALDYFMRDRRPEAWNGWAEVVGRDAREPRFIGDMPHAWISSDYIRSALDLFAYEGDDGAIVLAAGVPVAWMESAEGVGVRDLRTPWGKASYTLRAEGRTLVLTLSGDAAPPGGWVLPWPYPGVPRSAARADGRVLAWSGPELRIPVGTKRVVIDRP